MSVAIERFDELNLSPPLLKALADLGYETPSPIQAATIPLLLAGHDIIGQAQTGTGKTAAFALPMLERIDLKARSPQLLVLTPTRELAIQVAEAFQSYARNLPGFHVLPIYGGQSMSLQLRQLRRPVHVVVGTPGRVMDHLRRESLSLAGLTGLVLDEADEMLRMGFIDDVDWILEHTPPERQIALFSATMPDAIRKVAHRHLREPQEIKIKSKTSTVEAVRQRYWQVTGLHKLDALTRILEVEDMDAVLIFVRTKIATEELAEKLEARGYACAALNGDMNQAQRERTVEQMKNGQLDIVIATDVAARGLDVQRISHVINYDIPYDTEAYIHRIGRTARAGRSGDAILFVSPREMRMLRAIEQATKQPITPMHAPSAEAIAGRRVAQFKQQIVATLEAEELEFFEQVVSDLEQEHNVTALQIASALAFQVQRERPLQLKDKKESKLAATPAATHTPIENRKSQPRPRLDAQAESLPDFPEMPMVRYRIDVGRNHGVTPKNIVGAIANEAGIDSRYIGRIDLYDDYSTVDLPDGMPKEVFHHLKKARLRQYKFNFRRLDETGEPPPAPARAERPERPARADRPAKPGRPDRPERPVRTERTERPPAPAFNRERKTPSRPPDRKSDQKRGFKPDRKTRPQ